MIPQVRIAAAGALEQTAHPDTLSPDTLRRAIIIRNWIPASDRPPLDAAIRKARLAGVEIGAWPTPNRDLELYATTVDGSGAQSILAASRVAKKGLFAGVLLRHGVGVVDGWADLDLARGKINKMLREAQMAAPTVRVDKGFLDTMVQHAIGRSVERGGVPPSSLLEIAEILGGAEWKDRRIDVKAEADRLFEGLDGADRTPTGSGRVRSGYGMDGDRRRVQFVVRRRPAGAEDAGEVAAHRPNWDDRAGDDRDPAHQARGMGRAVPCVGTMDHAAAEAKQRARARDLVLVAHALAGDHPLEEIPVMAMIAANTVRAMLLGGW